MEDTRLIIVTGISGSGKSTTSKKLAEQYRLNGIRCCWLHEEIRRHPIRDGEFSYGSLKNAADFEYNIQDMYRRWEKLVKRVLRSKSVYVMEGVLYDNIIRYFYINNYPVEKITGYYDRLAQIMAPASPIVVELLRPDVQAGLEPLYPVRGMWWKDLIMDAGDYQYFIDHHLQGEEGVYQMWQDYQALGDAMFERLEGRKIKIDTSAGQWDSYLEQLTGYLGLKYIRPVDKKMDNPQQYCGRYTVEVDQKQHSIVIDWDGESLVCRSWWPTMRLRYLGGSRFTFCSFPIDLDFRRNGAGQVNTIRVSGIYDWEIVGQTMTRVLSDG